MTRYGRSILSGEPPWPHTSSVEEAPKKVSPRQEAAYTCERGCVFTLTFAADVPPPPAWDCRCGGKAALNGTPENALAEVSLPGYASIGTRHKGAREPEMTPFGQLLKRRSVAELEEAVAARIAELKGGRP